MKLIDKPLCGCGNTSNPMAIVTDHIIKSNE